MDEFEFNPFEVFFGSAKRKPPEVPSECSCDECVQDRFYDFMDGIADPEDEPQSQGDLCANGNCSCFQGDALAEDATVTSPTADTLLDVISTCDEAIKTLTETDSPVRFRYEVMETQKVAVVALAKLLRDG